MDYRYIPQKRVAEIGEPGQKKLREASVLIVGCGALGSHVAMYLAGAGVGKLTICDFDNVDLSNLHRQVFYTQSEVGRNKAQILKSKMLDLNSDIQVEAVTKLVTSAFLEKSQDWTLIIDAADNPSTTYMLDDFCKKKGIPLCIAGVSGWEAQVFTFIPGSFSYGDFFDKPTDETGVLPCSIAGIVGSTASYAASVQCAQAIKIILECNSPSSSLIIADLLNDSFKSIC